MLALMKNLLPGATDRKTQAELQSLLRDASPGGVLGFGFMPQAALSGRRLEVAHIRTYAFGDDRLASLVLKTGSNADISLIAVENDEESYLAISRAIDEAEREKLFGKQSIAELAAAAESPNLTCVDKVLGFRGWVAPYYQRTLHGVNGSVSDGDYRHRPLPEDAAQHFTYAMFANPGGEYAIEVEHYDSGRVEVYATVYRRLQDIMHIAAATPVSGKTRREEEQEAQTLATVRRKISLHRTRPQLVKAEPEEREEISMLEEPKVVPISEAVSTPATRKEPQLASVETPPAPAANAEDHAWLACDMALAGRMLEEAQRNAMRLSDVIRRVIDLPLAVDENVYFGMPLSESDCGKLAGRYGVGAKDRKAIEAGIIAELRAFAGGTKE